MLPSATVPLASPLRMYGTLCRPTSRHRHHCLSSCNISKPSYTQTLTRDIVINCLTSVKCSRSFLNCMALKNYSLIIIIIIRAHGEVVISDCVALQPGWESNIRVQNTSSAPYQLRHQTTHTGLIAVKPLCLCLCDCRGLRCWPVSRMNQWLLLSNGSWKMGLVRFCFVDEACFSSMLAYQKSTQSYAGFCSVGNSLVVSMSYMFIIGWQPWRLWLCYAVCWMNDWPWCLNSIVTYARPS